MAGAGMAGAGVAGPGMAGPAPRAGCAGLAAGMPAAAAGGCTEEGMLPKLPAATPPCAPAVPASVGAAAAALPAVTTGRCAVMLGPGGPDVSGEHEREKSAEANAQHARLVMTDRIAPV
jgi:hypothetical protein